MKQFRWIMAGVLFLASLPVLSVVVAGALANVLDARSMKAPFIRAIFSVFRSSSSLRAGGAGMAHARVIASRSGRAGDLDRG